jgi:hypothetical protein
MVGQNSPKLLIRYRVRIIDRPGPLLLRWAERNAVDFGTQNWYTRHTRAYK